MSNHNKGRFGGRGYYIALILCALAIGVWSYVSYEKPDTVTEDTLNTPVSATTPVTKPAKPGQKYTETTPGETAQATKPTAGRLSVCAPVEGEVISEYAMEALSYNQTTRDWRVHNGVDYGAEAGTSVVAVADGEVYTVYEDEQMGYTVVILHEGGYVTQYASLDAEVSVSPGDAVQMGQTIGTVGSTALMENALGDHVHFSVTKNDEPVDPMEFLNR